MNRFRIMTAAVSSGSGKTIITCGLLSFMKNRGLNVSSFKCGPDYIDPMFHRRVLGIPGGNLDTFFAGENEIRSLAAGRTSDDADDGYAVIEGVMGIYDGIASAAGTGASGSCYEVAKITETPVVLIVNSRGMGQTVISVIRGILADDRECLIRGIILNRISPHYYEQIKPLLVSALDEISRRRGVSAELLGGIPTAENIKLESRHLGLMMPHEIEDLQEQIKNAERLIADNLDTGRLLEIMSGAGSLITEDKTAVYHSCHNEESLRCSAPGTDLHDGSISVEKTGVINSDAPVLAVARDEAFCFYYEENLRMLEQNGIRIKEFSPLHDRCLPEDADGILLGGGYPELYAETLSGNTGMRVSVRDAIRGGMPSLAECGGFMYLLEMLEDSGDKLRPMAGVLRGTASNRGRLGRFGYITLHDRGMSDETLITGLCIKGHEFHYFDSDNNGSAAVAVKPGSGRSWECMHAGPGHLWGYPHLYYPSCPELVERFRKRMIAFAKYSRA